MILKGQNKIVNRLDTRPLVKGAATPDYIYMDDHHRNRVKADTNCMVSQDGWTTPIEHY